MIIFLLIFVWLFGSEVRNTHRWIEWGFIRIQPSEYAKIVLILINSAILASILRTSKNINIEWVQQGGSNNFIKKILNLFNKELPYYKLISRYVLALSLSVISIVLVLVEPALGNAVITSAICASLYFVSSPSQIKLIVLIISGLLSANIIGNIINFDSIYDRINFHPLIAGYDIFLIIISTLVILILTALSKTNIKLIILSILLGILFSFGIKYYWNNIIDDYQKSRVEIFLDPTKDPTGAGWQVRQSQIAIGSGQLWGKGFLQGSQSKLRYLPDAYTDFIFAALCEEFGFVGGTFVLILYAILIYKIIRIGEKADDIFESLICSGIAAMILLHVLINIGMNLGVLPVTGIPLPLLSYGGSSVMVTMIALGFVQSISTKEPVIDTTDSLVVTSMDNLN